jgi:hypothetical protein
MTLFLEIGIGSLVRLKLLVKATIILLRKFKGVTNEQG